jgi:FKBP-type peptidyl-prolyl cis-trans isomerase
MLDRKELELVTKGFADALLKLTPDEERDILLESGQKLQDILNERAFKAINEEKKQGTDFSTKYLLTNPQAVRTSSGLIYHEIIAGIGKQVSRFFVLFFRHSVILMLIASYIAN